MMTSCRAFERVAVAATSMASAEFTGHNGVNSADYVTSSGSRRIVCTWTVDANA